MKEFFHSFIRLGIRLDYCIDFYTVRFRVFFI